MSDNWFRPPRHLEMCRRGDRERYLWVAEPVALKGVYGVGYELTATIAGIGGDKLREWACSEARKELDRRIAAGDSRGEGCLWEDFEWQLPPMTREVEAMS